MTTEPTGPAADSTLRVPRSPIDDNYVRGEPLPPSRIGIGIVVAVGLDECVVLIGDEEIPGVVFLGFPPAVGDVVEVEARGDLLVITAERDIDIYVEGRRNDAQHVVSDEDPGPLVEDLNVAGSMTDDSAWVLYPPDDAAWQREQDDPTKPGLRVFQVAASAAGTLWSTETFAAEPEDVFTVSATVSPVSGGTASVQLVVLYGTEEDAEPLPGVATPLGAVTPVAAEDTAVGPYDVVVPETVGGDEEQPRTIRFGFQVTSPESGDAHVSFTSASATHHHAGWPLGSLWLDPNAPDGGATTAVHSGVGEVGLTDVPFTSTGTWYDMPSTKKAVVTAPPGTGGVVSVTASFVLFARSAGNMEFGIWASGPNLWSNISRAGIGTGTAFIPVTLQGYFPVQAGEEIDLSPRFRYITTPATVFQQSRFVISAVFLPGAVMAGGDPVDPSIRYFDGDSWRPDRLLPAAMDVSQQASPPNETKLATSTTLTKSASTLTEGSSVTLTATVSNSATGSVTFERSGSASGPWTTVGTSTLSSGKATRSWTTTKGTWYLRARYLGSSTRLASTSAVSTALTVQGALVTKTVTRSAQWVQAYNGSGAQISGSGADTAVHQGYYSSTHGVRKSLIRFDPSLPSDAEVTKVELVCSSWAHWYNAAGGTLVVGWHEQNGTPSLWGYATTHTDRSRHSVDTGSWTVNLTSWAAGVVKWTSFRGVTIGPPPGSSTSREYYGYSSGGTSPWKLKVTFRTRT